jgi:hypothetical protein
MIGLKHYKQVCTRYHKEGDREFTKGEVINVVSLTEREAETNNSQKDDHGIEYILLTPEEENIRDAKIEEERNIRLGIKTEEKPTVVEKTDKEYRATLFAKSTELGLNPPKNIKTENLEKQITEAEGK